MPLYFQRNKKRRRKLGEVESKGAHIARTSLETQRFIDRIDSAHRNGSNGGPRRFRR